MTEDEALVHAALADPDDRTPRLVFADWLDEHDFCNQAEAIRARCALDTMPADHPDRTALAEHEQTLSERHAADWVEQCGLLITWEQALALFRRRLAETAAWCGRGAGTLRNLALAPDDFVFRDYRTLTAFERQVLVNRLANRRAGLLADRGGGPSIGGAGRLLMFYPDATLFDGAAEVESEGFFDQDNAPAWNTWVWMADDRDAARPMSYRSYLVCWVPPDCLDRANAGIMVNPEECIRWMADVDTALTRRLRDAGLLT